MYLQLETGEIVKLQHMNAGNSEIWMGKDRMGRDYIIERVADFMGTQELQENPQMYPPIVVERIEPR
jgi:hypothetical protein